jgi:hypothetical protein
MLEIPIPPQEIWDPVKENFIKYDGGVIKMEHSLRAIQKWEAKYKKPFLSKEEKTEDEVLFYLKCMTLNKVEDVAYSLLTNSDMEEISNYISEQRTATTIKPSSKGSRKVPTAEVMYYWLSALQIPFEVADWHLSQLLTLVEVANELNNPKKMKKSDVYNQYDALNEMRKAKYKTKG